MNTQARGNQRFGGTVVFRTAGQPEHIAGPEQLDELAAAVGKNLVEHDRAVDDLVTAAGGIAIGEQEFVLAHHDRGRRVAARSRGVLLDAFARTACISVRALECADIGCKHRFNPIR